MYRLYNVKAWGSMSVHLLLDAMRVPYENRWMSIADVRAPEFRRVSPLGFIPALSLDDGRVLFETAAIMIHLVVAHPEKGLAPKPGSGEFGEFLSWMELLNSNLYVANNMAFHGDVYAQSPEHNAFIIAKAIERANELWRLIDRRLADKGPWLMGEKMSAADLYAFTAVTWGRPNEKAVTDAFPHVAKLAAAIRAMPVVRAALEAHGVLEP